MDSKMNIWDKQQQNWIKEILSKSGTELKEISDKNGNDQVDEVDLKFIELIKLWEFKILKKQKRFKFYR